MKVINDKFNGIRVVQHDDGKYGLQEIIDGCEQEPVFRWRTLYLATKTAQAISNENDRTDAYVKAHQPN